jgi:hypothetical protein
MKICGKAVIVRNRSTAQQISSFVGLLWVPITPKARADELKPLLTTKFLSPCIGGLDL